MSKKGEVKKLSNVQRTAIIYLKKELTRKESEFERLKRLWTELVREISIGLDIPDNERADWKLTDEQDAVIYQPKERKESKK